MSITRIAPLAKTIAFGGVAKQRETVVEDVGTSSVYPHRWEA